MTVDDLDVTIHFVKENAVVSKNSRSSDKFLHGIKVLMAKNYVDNLSEEVKKGLLEKAEQGYWPTVAPVGYVNNRTTHRIEVDAARGSPQLRAVRLRDDRGTQESQVHVQPLHSVPRPLWECVHPRRATCAPARRPRQDSTSRTHRQRDHGGPSREPGGARTGPQSIVGQACRPPA